MKEWKQALIGVLGTALLASVGAGIHLWRDNAVYETRIEALEKKIEGLETKDSGSDEAMWRKLGDLSDRVARLEGAKR